MNAADLTLDEWDTIRNVLHDNGKYEEHHIADWNKVQALKSKLGVPE